ncbi:MAG: hypothetical protein IPJ45_07070 [Ignavibacteria bacterium]|nr:hypothetical protein [Ignavibacteria bacterium]
MIVTHGLTPSIPTSSSDVTFPSISADITNGSRRGNIYITFCDARNRDPDIFLVRSTNRGANWSAESYCSIRLICRGEIILVSTS